MFIEKNVHTDRNPKNTKHWQLSWYRYETFITFFKFRFSTRGERDIQFFYADCSSSVSFQLTDTTNARAHSAVHNWTGLTQVQKSLHLSPNPNSLLLFKITKIPNPSLPGMTSFTSPVYFLSGVFIVTSVIVTSPSRARELLHSMCAPN